MIYSQGPVLCIVLSNHVTNLCFQQAPVQGTGPVQGVKFLSVCLSVSGQALEL